MSEAASIPPGLPWRANGVCVLAAAEGYTSSIVAECLPIGSLGGPSLPARRAEAENLAAWIAAAPERIRALTEELALMCRVVMADKLPLDHPDVAALVALKVAEERERCRAATLVVMREAEARIDEAMVSSPSGDYTDLLIHQRTGVRLAMEAIGAVA